MSWHDPKCSSLVVLLSHPPKMLPCDCWLSRTSELGGGAATSPPYAGPQPGNPGRPMLPLPVLAEIADGAPPAPTAPPAPLAPENVVRLVPNKAIGPSPEEMATYLEDMAARVRSGEWPALTHVVLLLNDAEQLFTPWVCGDRMTGGQLVGLLEYTKHAVIVRGTES